MRVLITGMSGTGKSSVVSELRRRGYLAYDADDDGYTEPTAGGGWRWRMDAVATLFAAHDSDVLFFAGCSEEQQCFDWDRKVLLTAPLHVIWSRLITRTNSPFGKTTADRQKVQRDTRDYEPLLRRAADAVIDSTQPLSAVVDQVIAASLEGATE